MLIWTASFSAHHPSPIAADKQQQTIPQQQNTVPLVSNYDNRMNQMVRYQ